MGASVNFSRGCWRLMVGNASSCAAFIVRSIYLQRQAGVRHRFPKMAMPFAACCYAMAAQGV
jgi:hypothetical protein